MYIHLCVCVCSCVRLLLMVTSKIIIVYINGGGALAACSISSGFAIENSELLSRVGLLVSMTATGAMVMLRSGACAATATALKKPVVA